MSDRQELVHNEESDPENIVTMHGIQSDKRTLYIAVRKESI